MKKKEEKVGEEKSLKVEVKPEKKVLWVNKMPLAHPIAQAMEVSLLVTWPYRSIWTGSCPTAQIYDFWIEYGKTVVWRWSKERYFADQKTEVKIPGGPDPRVYTEIWKFNPKSIKKEGTYTLRGRFIASGQEATKNFEIKFAV